MVKNQRCILIADDEPKMVRALKDFFRAKDFYVLEAGDGAEALERFWEYNTKIDLILLDVMMPVKDGLAVLGEIRGTQSNVPVILLTAKGEEYDQLSGFSKGADDYVTKPFSPSLLLARVEAVLRRFGKDTQQDVVAGDLAINPATRTVLLAGSPLELTRREYDLLYFLAINRSLTFSREQILNNVWGYNFEGGVRTVDTHIRQLRTKLGKYADYIKTIHCVGYQFEV
ncbi:MAG: response regulator transcription factor [Bariatricus sp.]